MEKRLDALAELGVVYQALPRGLAGAAGYIHVTSHFEQLQHREGDKPDLLVVVADPIEGDFHRFLDECVTAAARLLVDLPVVVGARPGRGLQHAPPRLRDLGRPLGAVQIVEDLTAVACVARFVKRQ